MIDLKSKKNKHLTFDDRLEIQECLNHGMTFKAIAKRVGKDQTTISKEVKKHIQINSTSIKRTNLKGELLENKLCPLLIKAPFVCNPCTKRHAHCAFQKHLYNAKSAHNEYETLLVEAREGIPLNKEAFYEMDEIVSKAIKKGQHLYHIIQTNDLCISKSTVYRHLHKGYLSVNALDFPRVVKFKARKKYCEKYVPKSAKIGRTYDDFLAYIELNNVSAWVEMDTVVGRIGGKTILTFDFTFCNFMIGLLLDDKTSASVTEKFRLLKQSCASNDTCFGEIFPLLLTDNGGEFANITAIESNAFGERETLLFYCDPYKSSQKPRVEKNHTLFRDIVPKGESFDSFSQETLNLIFSHINSVKRKSLNGKSPFEMFTFTYGEKIAATLGIKEIPANDVIQSPKLLKI